MTRRAAAGLDELTDVVREEIAAAEVAGFDETGLRVAGKLTWVHCARTDKYTLITCHAKPGRAGPLCHGHVRQRAVGASTPPECWVDSAGSRCTTPRDLTRVGAL